MMNIKGICNTVANKKKTCAVLSLVGGLHMALSENQPVLGMIDLPTVTLMGKTVGVQTVLGLGLAVCGGCCLVACM